MSDPETRPSLILRVRDSADRDAWSEFSSLYRPVVIAMARRHGMQDSDAEDLAQQVLLSISQSIERFQPDASQAKFRTWLKTIARRAIINALTRRPVDVAQGGSDVAAYLHQHPDANQVTEELSLEYRQEIFRIAAERVRPEFTDQTWTAFWKTVVQAIPVDVAANELGQSRGSVYTARSRVMQKLKQCVQELDLAEEAPQS